MMDELITELLKGKNFSIMMHKSPDPDAIASAIVLARILRKLGKEARVMRTEKINEQASLMLSSSDEELQDIAEGDTLVVVDTSSLAMIDLDIFENFKGRRMAIDHHAERENYPGFDFVYVDETALANSLLIFELAKKLNVELCENSLLLLGVGIITDTADFVVADPRVFFALAEITKKVKYDKVSEIARMRKNLSERVARLKAASRAKIYIVGEYVIATTKVSAFEGSVASSLLELGSDVSFVVSSGKQPRLSSRASQILVSKGLHLGKNIMSKVSERFECDSGGHAGAAGATGFKQEDTDAVLAYCVDLTTLFIKGFTND